MIVKETAESQAVKPAVVFGETAVDMGFLSAEQLQEALAVQSDIDVISGTRPRKLIGDILFEKGWITVEQIYIVQRKVFDQLV
jgi:hypothetical protein